MIIYNVTLNVDEDIASEWMDWMKQVHIPEVMETGVFTDYRICRVLAEEAGGFTYAVQYSCPDMDAYERYRTTFAPGLQAKTLSKYGSKIVAFRTLLEVLG